MKPRRMWADIEPWEAYVTPTKKHRRQIPVLVIPITGEAVEGMVRYYAKKSFGRHWAHPSHIEIARHVLSILGITAPRPAGEKDTTP